MNDQQRLRRYKCHKQVLAAKILKVEEIAFSDTYDIRLKTDAGNVDVPAGWAHKHKPRSGGYYVRYEDGYTSYSPAAAFEAGYSPAEDADSNVQLMGFGQAIDALKAGKKVARAGWNGKGMVLWLNKGAFDGEKWGFSGSEQPLARHPSTIDGVSLGLFEAHMPGVVTRLPNINMRSAGGATVTGWLASQTDMLAEDWMIAE